MPKKQSNLLIFSIAALIGSASVVMYIGFRPEDPKTISKNDEPSTQQKPTNLQTIAAGVSSPSAASSPLAVTVGQPVHHAPLGGPQSSSGSFAGKVKVVSDQPKIINTTTGAEPVSSRQPYPNNVVTYPANTGQFAQPANAPAPSEASASNSLSPVPEQEIAVPPGAIAPAALYDDGPKTPQQEAALERILNEFQEAVTENVGEGLSQTELWEAARLQADRRYLTLFGWQAYNARHLQSAKEAVHEKRALEGPN